MNIQEITKLADLIRIEIPEDQKEKVLKDFDAILAYVSKIQEVQADIKNDGHLPATLENVMREDISPHESGAYTEDILNIAPATENGYIKVKKILNND